MLIEIGRGLPAASAFSPEYAKMSGTRYKIHGDFILTLETETVDGHVRYLCFWIRCIAHTKSYVRTCNPFLYW